jgi:hypothetical protein
MATAFLLGNCHSLLIVIWRLLTGGVVTHMEAIGVAISLGGPINGRCCGLGDFDDSSRL